MKNYLILLAGGAGMRMGASIPKQFLLLAGRPILMHSMEAFASYDAQMELILVLPEGQEDYWAACCEEHQFTLPHHIVKGGKERFFSVKNALEYVKEVGLLAVHDAVRPLVSQACIAAAFASAEKYGSGIPVVDLVDSIRKTEGEKSFALDRKAYKLVQTPQVFAADLLQSAYQQDFSPLFTDDASVVEAFGEAVFLSEGNVENIKITTPKDLEIAKVLL